MRNRHRPDDTETPRRDNDASHSTSRIPASNPSSDQPASVQMSIASASADGGGGEVRPFEWLTNSASLADHLSRRVLFPEDGDGDSADAAAAPSTPRRALHVGCGTSTLGERLAVEMGYAEVVNADIDGEVLDAMERRWKWRQHTTTSSRQVQKQGGAPPSCGTMRWMQMDFGQPQPQPQPQPQAEQEQEQEQEQTTTMAMTVADPDQVPPLAGGSFDLVVDKSTLDCALCAEDAAAGLLALAHGALRPGGAYFVVSFHHVDFILPLLRDCPGADWEVRCEVVRREVDVPEHLVARLLCRGTGQGGEEEEGGEKEEEEEEGEDEEDAGPQQQRSAWSDGTFDPDAGYRRTCNVFVCRRPAAGAGEGGTAGLDLPAVRDHVHRTNNDWFKRSNPMVTRVRESDLRRAFAERLGGIGNGESGTLPLCDCFDVLFTDAEREHLDYEFFLEDWNAYTEGRPGRAEDCLRGEEGMSVEVAMDFLREMQ